MKNNPVEILSHYDHLVTQIDDKRMAVQHVCQRYGITPANLATWLMERDIQEQREIPDNIA